MKPSQMGEAREVTVVAGVASQPRPGSGGREKSPRRSQRPCLRREAAAHVAASPAALEPRRDLHGPEGNSVAHRLSLTSKHAAGHAWPRPDSMRDPEEKNHAKKDFFFAIGDITDICKERFF